MLTSSDVREITPMVTIPLNEYKEMVEKLNAFSILEDCIINDIKHSRLSSYSKDFCLDIDKTRLLIEIVYADHIDKVHQELLKEEEKDNG